MSASGDKTPFHNPFAVLGGRRTDEAAVPGPAAHATPAPAAAPAGAAPPPAADSRIPRAVVRIERSGRGGKDVTVIEHLAIDASTRERWLKELKAALGCGGTLEGDAIALQGDQRKRVPKLLSEKGVRKITVA